MPGTTHQDNAKAANAAQYTAPHVHQVCVASIEFGYSPVNPSCHEARQENMRNLRWLGASENFYSFDEFSKNLVSLGLGDIAHFLAKQEKDVFDFLQASPRDLRWLRAAHVGLSGGKVAL